MCYFNISRKENASDIGANLLEILKLRKHIIQKEYVMVIVEQLIIEWEFWSPIATTQPTTQNNLKQFCWGGIIIGWKNHHHTTPHHHTGTDYI